MLNSRKILDKVTSKTKIYLFIILILLIRICTYKYRQKIVLWQALF